jgi:hypothetical protein
MSSDANQVLGDSKSRSGTKEWCGNDEQEGSRSSSVARQADSSFAVALMPRTVQIARVPTLVLSSSDIIFGRGRGHDSHPGNSQLRILLDSVIGRYCSASRSGKTHISEDVLRQLATSARFLKYDKSFGAWVQVDNDEARKKVSQALRYKQRQAMPTTPSRQSRGSYSPATIQDEHIMAAALLPPALAYSPAYAYELQSKESSSNGNLPEFISLGQATLPEPLSRHAGELFSREPKYFPNVENLEEAVARPFHCIHTGNISLQQAILTKAHVLNEALPEPTPFESDALVSSTAILCAKAPYLHGKGQDASHGASSHSCENEKFFYWLDNKVNAAKPLPTNQQVSHPANRHHAETFASTLFDDLWQTELHNESSSEGGRMSDVGGCGPESQEKQVSTACLHTQSRVKANLQGSLDGANRGHANPLVSDEAILAAAGGFVGNGISMANQARLSHHDISMQQQSVWRETRPLSQMDSEIVGELEEAHGTSLLQKDSLGELHFLFAPCARFDSTTLAPWPITTGTTSPEQNRRCSATPQHTFGDSSIPGDDSL